MFVFIGTNDDHHFYNFIEYMRLLSWKDLEFNLIAQFNNLFNSILAKLQ